MIGKLWKGVLIFFAISFFISGIFGPFTLEKTSERMNIIADPVSTIFAALFSLAIGSLCLYFGFFKQKKVIKKALENFNKNGHVDSKEIAVELGMPHKKIKNYINEAQRTGKLPKAGNVEIKDKEKDLLNKEQKKIKHAKLNKSDQTKSQNTSKNNTVDKGFGFPIKIFKILTGIVVAIFIIIFKLLGSSSAASKSSSNLPKKSSSGGSKRKSKTSHIGKDRKCCATCDFWGGARGPNAGKKFVVTDEWLKGPCMVRQQHIDKKGISICPHYKKWSILK